MARFVTLASTVALALGVAAIVVALVRWEESADGNFAPGPRFALLVFTGATVVLLVHLVRTLLASRRGSLSELEGFRFWRFGALVTMGAAAGYCCWHTASELTDGLFGSSLTLLTAGLLVVLLALGTQTYSVASMALRAPSGTQPVPSGLGRLGAASATGAGVAALLLVPGYFAVPWFAVDASTAEPVSGPPAEVPANVNEVGWRWQTPEGTRVRSVEPAGSGVVVLLDDGVVALDGATGEQRWQHRRPGATTEELTTGAEGTSVLVSFVSGELGVDRDRRMTTVFDAYTGATRFEFTESTSSTEDSSQILGSPAGHGRHPVGLTRDRVVTLTEGDIVARDLDDSQEQWRWPPSDECHIARIRDLSFVTLPDSVVVAALCSNTKHAVQHLTLLALDERDGSQQWRVEENVTHPAFLDLLLSTDGATLALSHDYKEEWQLINGVNGKPVNKGISDFDPPPNYGSPSWYRFDAEGRLTESGFLQRFTDDFRLAYTWHPNDGGEPRTATLQDYCAFDDHSSDSMKTPHSRALRDAVLVPCVTGSPSPSTDEVDSAEVEVAAAPWGFTGEAEDTLTVEFDVATTSSRIFEWPRESPPLFAAPGAVVATLPSATEVVGLQ